MLVDAFSDLVAADPAAFRRKFRTMAGDPFAFYRGSACLFYADAAERDDPWADERTARVWVQGDLHAQNFGTYMDGEGLLVFDVNDFDEAYLGHFTWDLQRFGASTALLGWTKALSDEDISGLVETYAGAYLDQVRDFALHPADEQWRLGLDTATGAVLEALHEAQRSSRVALLDSVTEVHGGARRFSDGRGVRRLDDAERGRVETAFAAYLETIPEAKRFRSLTYALKDVVGKSGFGIGSAGLPAYNVLVEGPTQALENDVVLTIKQGGVAAPSRVVDDARAREAFAHHGHRTAVSQRALQAHADPWLGWCELDGTGFVVSEYSPYEADLDWTGLTEPDDMREVVAQLGRATARVHCVSDADDSSTPLVDFQVEEAVLAVVDGREREFIADLVAFSHDYAARVREDHAHFADAFRSGLIPGV